MHFMASSVLPVFFFFFYLAHSESPTGDIKSLQPQISAQEREEKDGYEGEEGRPVARVQIKRNPSTGCQTRLQVREEIQRDEKLEGVGGKQVGRKTREEGEWEGLHGFALQYNDAHCNGTQGWIQKYNCYCRWMREYMIMCICNMYLHSKDVFLVFLPLLW